MQNPKIELIHSVATALTSYGFTVYLSADKRYGFYTDGQRVVCFGGQWNCSVDFSGNYAPSRTSGTGWQIAGDQGVPTANQANQWIKVDAPTWTGNHSPTYTTPAQHLKTYGKSSGYTLFGMELTSHDTY